jgi:hypothetical protein
MRSLLLAASALLTGVAARDTHFLGSKLQPEAEVADAPITKNVLAHVKTSDAANASIKVKSEDSVKSAAQLLKSAAVAAESNDSKAALDKKLAEVRATEDALKKETEKVVAGDKAAVAKADISADVKALESKVMAEAKAETIQADGKKNQKAAVADEPEDADAPAEGEEEAAAGDDDAAAEEDDAPPADEEAPASEDEAAPASEDAPAPADGEAPASESEEDAPAPEASSASAEEEDKDADGEAEAPKAVDKDGDGDLDMPAYVPPPAPLTPQQKLDKKLAATEAAEKKEIAEEEAEVTKETESKALGHMLGDMREQMLDVDEKLIRMEHDIDDGIKIQEENPLPIEVFPLSSTMKAIINLSIQYFVIFTALAVIRTFNGLFNIVNSSYEKIFLTACDTVSYAPMLCVLFLGARMRALQITQGEGNPQDWCRFAMEMCAWAVLAQTLLVLAIPLFTGEIPEVDKDGNLRGVPKNGGNFLAGVLNMVRYTAMLCLYGGFSLVCVAVFLMDAETLNAKDKTLWDDPKTEKVELAPPVSPAVDATLNLTLQYFAVYLALAVFASLAKIKQSPFMTSMLETLKLAKYTVNMAPMLCVLFIGARMRALQIDPVHGSPQPWAQFCFYMCAYSVLVQTLMVLLMPFIGGAAKPGEIEGDVRFDGSPGAGTFLLVCVRYVALLSLYGGFTIVIISILIIKAPHGMPTPPVSPAMACVMNLTCQYFTVYMMLFMAQTFSQLTGKTNVNILKTLSASLGSVTFCPMLAILFVGVRMRALQLSKQKGSPQCFAQDAMFLATYATLVQLLMTLLLGAVHGPPRVDDDGSPIVDKTAPRWIVYAVEAVKWLGLVGIYGGAVTVISSTITITPQTAFCDPNAALVPTTTTLMALS